uniref:Uncharacterized protein n=1 Tax=Anopheles coluzzii TaxID=1518534 RepID=A0A8W7Q0U3_ANOCL
MANCTISGERLRRRSATGAATVVAVSAAGSSPKLFTFETELTFTMFTFVPCGDWGSRLTYAYVAPSTSSARRRRTRSSSFADASSLAASPKPAFTLDPPPNLKPNISSRRKEQKGQLSYLEHCHRLGARVCTHN